MTWLRRLFSSEDRPAPDESESSRAQSALKESERVVQRSKIEAEEARALTERLKEIRTRNHLAAGLRIRLLEAQRD